MLLLHNCHYVVNNGPVFLCPFLPSSTLNLHVILNPSHNHIQGVLNNCYTFKPGVSFQPFSKYRLVSFCVGMEFVDVERNNMANYF